MARKRRIGARTLMEIQQKAHWRWSGPDVLSHLESLYAKGEVETVPALRTIQATMREYATPVSQDLWTLTDADPEDLPLIMDTLRTLAVVTEGKRLQLTRREAELAARVYQVAPELSPGELLDWARCYVWCEEKSIDSTLLDLLLAFAPWRSADSARNFVDCVGVNPTARFVITGGAPIPLKTYIAISREIVQRVEADRKKEADK